MSLLSDFAKDSFFQARKVIGTKIMSISGGTGVEVVLNEARFERDYEIGGYGDAESLTATAQSAEFVAAYPLTPANYLGLTCVVDGDTWRIQQIIAGDATTDLILSSKEDSA